MPHKDPTKKKDYQSGYYRTHKQESNQRKDRWRNENPEKVLWQNAKKRAKKVGLEFSIEVSDITIPEICPVFGTPMVMTHGQGKKGWNPNPFTPTIDRLDNTKGYVKGNIWVISWHANRLKSNATLDELEKLTTALRARTHS